MEGENTEESNNSEHVTHMVYAQVARKPVHRTGTRFQLLASLMAFQRPFAPGRYTNESLYHRCQGREMQDVGRP